MAIVTPQMCESGFSGACSVGGSYRMTGRMRTIALAAVLLILSFACGNGSHRSGSAGESCGPKTCAGGEVCCNQSCGICTPPGGACIQTFCGTP
jgi:hypothetical protein